MTDVQQTLLATYKTLQLQEGMLRAACSTEQAKVLDENYSAARKAYWEYMDRAFQNNDAEVEALAVQLNAVNGELSHSLEQLNNINKVLQTISVALALGIKLAARAAVL